jgi:hypothetical protein
MTKPSIVFAHGLWADGSCFSKLIPTLLARAMRSWRVSTASIHWRRTWQL